MSSGTHLVTKHMQMQEVKVNECFKHRSIIGKIEECLYLNVKLALSDYNPHPSNSNVMHWSMDAHICRLIPFCLLKYLTIFIKSCTSAVTEWAASLRGIGTKGSCNE